jgi:hypothetical protein
MRTTQSEEHSLASSLQREIDQWKSERQGAAAANSPAASGGPAPVSATPRGARAPVAGPGDVAGGEGVQANNLVANFDQAAAQRLRAASEATKQRAQTFNAQPLKGILRRQGAQDSGTFCCCSTPRWLADRTTRACAATQAQSCRTASEQTWLSSTARG